MTCRHWPALPQKIRPLCSASSRLAAISRTWPNSTASPTPLYAIASMPSSSNSHPASLRQRHLAEQLATQLLQAHEQGRFETLGPEEATESVFARVSLQRVQRPQPPEQTGNSSAPLGVWTSSKPGSWRANRTCWPTASRAGTRYCITRSARRPRPGRQAGGPVDQTLAGADAVNAYRHTQFGTGHRRRHWHRHHHPHRFGRYTASRPACVRVAGRNTPPPLG